METVKTATGKEFECESFSLIEDPQRLYIRIRNTPISTIAAVFSNPKETMQLYYGDIYVSQFTQLLGIIPENGMIRVNLTRG